MRQSGTIAVAGIVLLVFGVAAVIVAVIVYLRTRPPGTEGPSSQDRLQEVPQAHVPGSPPVYTRTGLFGVVDGVKAPYVSTGSNHKGVLLVQPPLSDLLKPKCGAFNGYVRWYKSTLVTFGGIQAIKCHHDANSGSTKPSTVGGVTIQGSPKGFPMSNGGCVLTLDAYWPTGYQWARGGKICGVGIGVGASGGDHSPVGASNRIMWQHDGGVILYVYLPTGVPQPNGLTSEKFGTGILHAQFAGALKTGQWNHLEIGTKLNTFTGSKPNADGAACLTVNGVSWTVNGIVWRSTPGQTLNDCSFMGEFFGGPLNSPVAQDCYYSNFGVYQWED
jgi:hypothetical protein